MDPKTNPSPDNNVNQAGTKKAVKPKKSFVRRVIKYTLITLLVIILAAGGILGGAILGYIKSAPLISADQLDVKNLTTFIYDQDGKTIGQLTGEQNRVLIDFDKDREKYTNLRNAFVAIEDKRFYEHNGIDIKRILSAVFNLFGTNSHGGSTITQQLVRNITGNTDRTLKRKVQEQWQAIQLEKKLDKQSILDLYLNLIYMGENYYGVQSASLGYFGKTADKLTLAESASLAGITNLPGKYAPYNDQNKKNNKERQEIILKEMLNDGYINQQQYEQAIKEPLKFTTGKKVEQPSYVSKQSYFVDKVVSDVINDLKAKGYSEQIASKMVYNNGLKIYTTQDSKVQSAMDSVFNNEKYFPKMGRSEHPQAAMVIIDPNNGQVKALYGGYGKKTTDRSFNRATDMYRQAGSSFKPIADYGPALNEGVITAASVFDDIPLHLKGGSTIYPKNFDSEGYRGLTTIRDAIKYSINTVAANVWMAIGPQISLKYLSESGIKLDPNKDNTVSVALGGLTKGVNPLLMAGAYQPFANRGIYMQPITYTKVEDRNGNVLIDKKKEQSYNTVYDERAAYIMTDMMKGVVKSGGTAAGYGQLQNGNMPSAGKTGTTDSNKDKWFVGYTPYYVGATWFGYDDQKYILTGSQQTMALQIWHDVMEKVHQGLQPKDFPMPDGIIKKPICIYSGKTPSGLCAKDPRGNAIREELFMSNYAPSDSDVCDVHVEAKIDKTTNLLFKDGVNNPLNAIIKVFVKRKVFNHLPGDPYPWDWKYELPTAYSTAQNTVSTIPTIKPSNTPVTSPTNSPVTTPTETAAKPSVTPGSSDSAPVTSTKPVTSP